MEGKIEFRRETGCVGAGDNCKGYHGFFFSERYRRDKCSCIPDGAGFLNRVRDTLESAVLLSGVREGNKATPTLTTSRRVVRKGSRMLGHGKSTLSV